MSLSIDALASCLTRQTSSYNTQEAMSLYLNLELTESLRNEVDDQAEFTKLVNYLELDTSMKVDSIF